MNLCSLVLALSLAAVAATAVADDCLVYFGTYTKGASKGIYVSRLNQETGSLSAPVLAGEVTNPSFLALHPNRRFLYAVGEVGKGGTVSAFAIDGKTGLLTLLNQQSTRGSGPCHVAVDKTGKCVLVANYGGGSVAALPVGDDGKLGESASFFQHEGSSVNPQRQKGPHAHGVTFDPAQRFAFVPDLGLDKVMIYKLDAAKAALTPNDPAFITIKPGAGPRHAAFHPSGKWLYVINEMGNTIAAFDANKFTEFQSVPTLPADFTAKSFTAEIEVHPSGKFLYGSNRGHDSIAVFAVDSQTGELTFVEHQSTQGKAPRNFAIDPTGKFLLAANQDSNNVVVFRIAADTGRLTPTGQSLEVPIPVCVVYLRR